MIIETATHRVTIADRDGLHLRAAALIAQTAHEFHSDIRIVYRNRSVDAKSVLDLLSLVAEHGGVLDLHATGPDSRMAVNALVNLIRNGCRNSLEGTQA